MNNTAIRSFSIIATAALVLASSAIGMDDEGERKAAHKKKAPPLEDITLTGMLTKTEKEGKNGNVSVTYTLTDANGLKTTIPVPKAKKTKQGESATEVIDLGAFVDQHVVVKGKGHVSDRGGKKSVKLKHVVSINDADDEGQRADNGAKNDDVGNDEGDGIMDDGMGGDMDGDMGDDVW